MRHWRSILAAFCWLGAAASGQEATPASTAPRLTVTATPEVTPPSRFTPTPVPPPISDRFPPADRSSSQGMAQIAGYLVLLVGLFGAGIYIMRNGLPTFRLGQKMERKLHIEETRSLGGRQFLVVAEYEGQRWLLGVCPGRIDHLCVLKSPEAPSFPKIAPELEEKA